MNSYIIYAIQITLNPSWIYTVIFQLDHEMPLEGEPTHVKETGARLLYLVINGLCFWEGVYMSALCRYPEPLAINKMEILIISYNITIISLLVIYVIHCHHLRTKTWHIVMSCQLQLSNSKRIFDGLVWKSAIKIRCWKCANIQTTKPNTHFKNMFSSTWLSISSFHLKNYLLDTWRCATWHSHSGKDSTCGSGPVSLGRGRVNKSQTFKHTLPNFQWLNTTNIYFSLSPGTQAERAAPIGDIASLMAKDKCQYRSTTLKSPTWKWCHHFCSHFISQSKTCGQAGHQQDKCI